MAKQVIRRQGSSQEHASFTGAEGEWTHDNTLNTGRFHDGVLSGGYPALLSNQINEISVSTNLDGSNFGEMIIADSTSSSFTITLPEPSVIGSGWQVAIKKSVDANSVTVSPFGGEGIDGDASVILENAENAVQVRTDGTSWYALRLNNFDDAQEILYDNSTSALSATTVQGAIDEVVVDSNDFATLDDGNTFNGNQTLNDDLTVNGDVAFQSYSFPSSDGSAGQALLTDGAGNLSFSDVAGDIIQEGNSSVEVVDTGTGEVSITVDGYEKVAVYEAIAAINHSNSSTYTPSTNSQPVPDGVGLEIANDQAGSNLASLMSFSSPGAGTAILYQGLLSGGDLASANYVIGGRVASGAYREYARITNAGQQRSLIPGDINSGLFDEYKCRAWVNFNGDNGGIRASGNVSSVTRTSTGNYTVNFSDSMYDADYAVASTAERTGSAHATVLETTSLSTTSCTFQVRVSTSGGFIDSDILGVAFFR